jgi:hypothetical protein
MNEYADGYVLVPIFDSEAMKSDLLRHQSKAASNTK